MIFASVVKGTLIWQNLQSGILKSKMPIDMSVLLLELLTLVF